MKMKAVDLLPLLPGQMRLEGDHAALEELGRFLRRLVHDLNNPMGTFGIEFFSIGMVAQQLQAAADAGDLAKVGALAGGLAEIQQNLQAAHGTASGILDTVEQQATTWTNADESAEGDS